ncbi:Putative Protein phosphatase [Rhizopus microsporus]|nr:Putative Protein phosphatase [Rhizopus microsporus]
MEDAHTTLLKLGDTNCSFFGVYDGHGGSSIAQYTGQTLYKKLLESKHFAKKEYKEAFRDAFMSVDKALLEDNNYALDPSGCTAVAALITDDNNIIVANAGDSRAIISSGGKAKPLSFDHKPTNEVEMERIIKAGGFVEFGRVNGNLALSRAIGDFEFKQSEELAAEEQVVTCNPDLTEHKITKEDDFIVLACDGIWDCMSNQEVVDFVQKGISLGKKLEEICEDLMDHCIADEETTNGLGYDNMSVIISFAMVIFGCLGAYLHWQSLGWKLSAGYLFIVIVGIGSILFHGTLQFQYQMWDEVPMIWTACYLFWLLLEEHGYKHVFYATAAYNFTYSKHHSV